MTLIKNVRELEVFKLAYQAALQVYNLTKDFPIEEKYGLTSQIRNSSRAVCGCLLEAWRRRRYPKNFVAKLNDAETEADETILWLDISKDSNYISEEVHTMMRDKYEHILAMLINMIRNPEKWKVN